MRSRIQSALSRLRGSAVIALGRGGDGARHHVLSPYADGARADRTAAYLSAAAVGFCLLYGMGVTGLAPQLAAALAAPPLLLGLVVIWALPDTDASVDWAPTALLFVFVAALVLWPPYLAFVPPGMPWITLVRLTAFPLALTLLVCVSISPSFRSDAAAALRGVSATWRLLLGFSVVAALSITWSADTATSAQHFILAQVLWTSVFFVSVNVFLAEGRARWMAGLLWAMAIVVGVIAAQEWRVRTVLWAGHIPSFLKIEDPSVVRALAGNYRLSGAYRAQATFSTPLGLGEYLALTLPFVIHITMTTRKLAVRMAAALSCAFILLVAALSGARLSLVGILVGVLLYALAWGVLKVRSERNSLLGAAAVLSYPAIFTAAVAASFLVGRIRNVVWGDGSQDSSNQARIDQWLMGIPKVLDQLWGYGLGMGAITLKYKPYGILTIDSYYLDILLEVGVIGFVFYYGMLLSAIYYGASTLWKRGQLAEEAGLLAPATIALCAFVVEKSVFSEPDNHPLAFMLMGMIAALAYRARRQGAKGEEARWESGGAPRARTAGAGR